MDHKYLSESTRKIWKKNQHLLRLWDKSLGRAPVKSRHAYACSGAFSDRFLRELKIEAATLRMEIQSLESEVQEHIGLHAASECMALCNLLQKKLPRELRDCIYELMLSRGTCHINSSPHVPDEYWASKVVRPRLLHLCNAQYVGSETRKEIVETWYRITNFQFGGGYSQDDHIPAFFARDRCGLNLNVRKLVTNVTLFSTCGLSEGSSIESLITGMEGLMVVESKIRITICIRLYGPYHVTKRYESWVEYINLLAKLFPPLQQLLQAGHQVKMDIDDKVYVFQVRENELTLEYWLEKLKLIS